MTAGKLSRFLPGGMLILWLLAMGYGITGETVHMVLGGALLVLTAFHMGTWRRWYAGLFRGRYGALRLWQTALNGALTLAMAGLLVSGILFLVPALGFSYEARLLHMVSAYWGFALMGLHGGMHWDRPYGMMKRAARSLGAPAALGLRLAGWLLMAGGLWIFLQDGLARYMFLQQEFVFFDTAKPLSLHMSEYLLMTAWWMGLSFHMKAFLQKKRRPARQTLPSARGGC